MNDDDHVFVSDELVDKVDPSLLERAQQQFVLVDFIFKTAEKEFSISGSLVEMKDQCCVVSITAFLSDAYSLLEKFASQAPLELIEYSTVYDKNHINFASHKSALSLTDISIKDIDHGMSMCTVTLHLS